MLSNFLTVVLLLSFAACKEYKKSENDNVSTVENLNKGDFESVITESSQKSTLTPRERYYLASAYSQSGGVDVFSLYSVMEIQLFHKKALEWSDLSKEKNPYLKFMKNQEGVDYEKRNKKREERWNKFLPKIKEKRGIKEKPTYDELVSEGWCNCSDLTQEEYNEADEYLKILAEKMLKDSPTIEEIDDLWYKEVYENPEHDEIRKNRAFSGLASTYDEYVYLEIMKRDYLNPRDKSGDAFGDVKWEMLYMNILWNTYESIPLLKKMPVLSNEQQDNVSKALEQYKLLLKSKKFKDVSVKNIAILSGVSLLSLYSESFDLYEVDSIQDLYCSFDPQIILNNYGLVRKRLFFLKDAFNEADIESDDYKKYQEQIKAIEGSIPEELSDEQKSNFIDSVDRFKVDSCFNG